MEKRRPNIVLPVWIESTLAARPSGVGALTDQEYYTTERLRSYRRLNDGSTIQPLDKYVGYVNAGDYLTLQAAIDACVNGDILQLENRTYVENVDFKGKQITVRGNCDAHNNISSSGIRGAVLLNGALAPNSTGAWVISFEDLAIIGTIQGLWPTAGTATAFKNCWIIGEVKIESTNGVIFSDRTRWQAFPIGNLFGGTIPSLAQDAYFRLGGVEWGYFKGSQINMGSTETGTTPGHLAKNAIFDLCAVSDTGEAMDEFYVQDTWINGANVSTGRELPIFKTGSVGDSSPLLRFSGLHTNGDNGPISPLVHFYGTHRVGELSITDCRFLAAHPRIVTCANTVWIESVHVVNNTFGLMGGIGYGAGHIQAAHFIDVKGSDSSQSVVFSGNTFPSALNMAVGANNSLLRVADGGDVNVTGNILSPALRIAMAAGSHVVVNGGPSNSIIAVGNRVGATPLSNVALLASAANA